MAKATASGCLPGFLDTASQLDKFELLKLNILQRLRKPGPTWLGLTEPTLCTRSTKRLHEQTPLSKELPSYKPAADLILQEADYARCQHELGWVQNTGQVILPKIVQYDLFHAIEALPQTREKADKDLVAHSFFFRANAEATLLEHIKAYDQYGVIPCLLWHTYDPFWENKSFYDMPFRQPFAPRLRELKDARQAWIFAANHLHLPRANWPTDISDEQATVLGILQGKLDRIANFARALAAADIVAMFRPWHEANGRWFWWSIRNWSESLPAAGAQMRKLWTNTRRYLEEVHDVNNLLYVWSPNVEAEWLHSPTAAISDIQFGVEMDEVDIVSVDLYPRAFVGKLTDSSDFRLTAIRTALQLLQELKIHFKDKPFGLAEIGADYSEAFQGDIGPKVADFGRGMGTIDELVIEHFQSKSDGAPDFAIWWRNDPGNAMFPISGINADMDEEFSRLMRNGGTQLADWVGDVVV